MASETFVPILPRSTVISDHKTLLSALEHWHSEKPKPIAPCDTVAYDTDEGAITFAPLEHLYILRIYVKPEHRNKGLFTAVLKKAQTLYSKITVPAPSTITHHIITKLGFKEGGSGEFHWVEV